MFIAVIIDLIILAIIVFCALLSAKHGFVRTLIEVVGFIAAFVIAFTVSSPLAEATYDKMIEPSIVSQVGETSGDNAENITAKIWNALPEVFRNGFINLGVSRESIDQTVSENLSQSAAAISTKVTKPIITKILALLYSTLIVIAVSLISKIVAKAVNKFFTFSVIGRINAMLGGIIGVIKGIGVVTILCMLISVIMLFAKDGMGIFTPDNIEATHLFKFFYGISPFV